MSSSTDHPNPDEHLEIILSDGPREAIVSPFGAALRGYYERLDDGSIREIVTRYYGAPIPHPEARTAPMPLRSEHPGRKMGGQGDVLIPFPGRIREGRYSFQGRSYQMVKNDGEGPNAIHGFLRSTTWQCSSISKNRAGFTTDLAPDDHPGYPFRLRAAISYEVGSEGLTCSFEITNTGEAAAPAAAGFHPYFNVGSPTIDTDELHLPMKAMLEFEGMLPTGGVIPVAGTPLDFRSPRRIGDTRINNCFLDPVRDESGRASIRLRSPETGRSVTVWMDRAFDFVVLYSGDPLPPEHRRRSLAIEPMTCGSDAFNHPEWGLAVLKPGERLQGSWGVSAS